MFRTPVGALVAFGALRQSPFSHREKPARTGSARVGSLDEAQAQARDLAGVLGAAETKTTQHSTAQQKTKFVGSNANSPHFQTFDISVI